jgi:hypothetical protein
VEARNLYGYSALYSNEVTILAAQIPDTPLAPTTSFDAAADTVTVVWLSPDNGGSPITSYMIYFIESDGFTYTTQLTDCDGSDADIMSALSCTIPSISLHEDPFNLPWASSVYAKIVATNIYGSSEYSVAGNGAVIYAVPDVPVTLTENSD